MTKRHSRLEFCFKSRFIFRSPPMFCFNKCSAVAEMGDHLATVDMGRKAVGYVPLFRGAGSPSNTVWPRPRSTSVPSFILIHPTVWPPYTNVADRHRGQTGQRSDSISLKNRSRHTDQQREKLLSPKLSCSRGRTEKHVLLEAQ